jgi:hypothetical protein
MKVNIDSNTDVYSVAVHESDCIDLDLTLAKIIYPALQQFKKFEDKPPKNISKLEWELILDKMIFAFGKLADQNKLPEEQDKPTIDRIREGLKLFTKHYIQLYY